MLVIRQESSEHTVRHPTSLESFPKRIFFEVNRRVAVNPKYQNHKKGVKSNRAVQTQRACYKVIL